MKKNVMYQRSKFHSGITYKRMSITFDSLILLYNIKSEFLSINY